MCFAPFLNVLRPLHQILSRYQFLSFFTFLFVDFLILTFEMLARSSSGWVLDYFWIDDHISSRNKMFSLTGIILFATLIFVILAQIWKSCVWVKCGEESLRWVFMNRKVLPSKSMKSQLSNALSSAPTALLAVEIS